MIKQDIDKLLAIGFIDSVEEATWLSSIVIVPKKNGKLRIYINFRKRNATIKKDPYPLPFIDEVLNIEARYDAYSFLSGYLGYYQVFIALEDKYKIAFVIDQRAFMWKVMLFRVKNGPQTYQRVMNKTSESIWTFF
jgi:hypothetical protein